MSRPLRVLIHSSDGYTESSLLALSYIMHTKACTLPESYLELQNQRERSFFVYPADVGVLRRIESKLGCKERARREREREAEKAGRERENAAALAMAKDASVVNGRWKWGSWRSSSLSMAGSPVLGAASSSAPTSSVMQSRPADIPRRARSSTMPILPAVTDHQTWFNDSRFDGSFPSRILPFLYLGNLNHASNVYMLHALGITHVVSVGECALVPPPAPVNSYSEYCHSGDNAERLPTRGSLWKEEKEGRIKVLDIKGVCDDGIDSLRCQFGPIIDWIDKARAEGGKVLVHCRVGVSRSATVTIAYVMHHLNIPLVDAYLMVRSRRLSVLIQPNMRLLYNLLGWELDLARRRAAEGKISFPPGSRMSWPFLAREVHVLNQRYLQ